MQFDLLHGNTLGNLSFDGFAGQPTLMPTTIFELLEQIELHYIQEQNRRFPDHLSHDNLFFADNNGGVGDGGVNRNSADELLQEAVIQSANGNYLFGNVDERKVKLNLTDNNGVNVTFSIIGNGSGEVVGGSNFDQIIVTNTDKDSRLLIETTGENTETTVGDIIVSGSLNRISAETTDLRGDIDIDGTVKILTLDDAIENSTIKIHNNDPHTTIDDKVRITLDQVQDLNLES